MHALWLDEPSVEKLSERSPGNGGTTGSRSTLEAKGTQREPTKNGATTEYFGLTRGATSPCRGTTRIGMGRPLG